MLVEIIKKIKILKEVAGWNNFVIRHDGKIFNVKEGHIEFILKRKDLFGEIDNYDEFYDKENIRYGIKNKTLFLEFTKLNDVVKNTLVKILHDYKIEKILIDAYPKESTFNEFTTDEFVEKYL